MSGSGAAGNLFQRLNEAMESTDFGWSLCLVGEDQTDKMSELTKGLRGNLDTGDGKQISSGFSYWGIGPTIAWSSACNDVFYPVMKESLQNFKANWRRVLRTMDSDRLHYVSLGVGTGDKDRAILEDMHTRFPDMIYLPVDMSSEMLRLGVKGTANIVPADRIIPVQLDISVAENLAELKRLLRNLLGDAPILFGLLGNTLANFDDDQKLLRMLSDLLRPQDRFLLELATTRSVVDKAQAAAEEYVSSRFFREFVTSALWHNTDLTVDMGSVGFHGSAEAGNRALRVRSATTTRPVSVSGWHCPTVRSTTSTLGRASGSTSPANTPQKASRSWSSAVGWSSSSRPNRAPRIAAGWGSTCSCSPTTRTPAETPTRPTSATRSAHLGSGASSCSNAHQHRQRRCAVCGGGARRAVVGQRRLAVGDLGGRCHPPGIARGPGRHSSRLHVRGLPPRLQRSTPSGWRWCWPIGRIWLSGGWRRSIPAGPTCVRLTAPLVMSPAVPQASAPTWAACGSPPGQTSSCSSADG